MLLVKCYHGKCYYMLWWNVMVEMLLVKCYYMLWWNVIIERFLVKCYYRNVIGEMLLYVVCYDIEKKTSQHVFSRRYRYILYHDVFSFYDTTTYRHRNMFSLYDIEYPNIKYIIRYINVYIYIFFLFMISNRYPMCQI